MLKCHRRCVFKKCRRQLLTTEALQLFGQESYLRFINHVAVHTDPFAELHKMRRGIEPYSIPSGLQHSSHYGRSRSFSVCPSDVQHTVSGLWHTESNH